MRVLFSTTSGFGHLHPLVPLASAFADEGHDVAFATSEALGEHVAALGLRTLPAGLDPAEADARARPMREALAQLPIPERRPVSFTWRFARVEAPGKLADLHEVARTFAPDLVVYEPCDLAAPIVAAALGIPSVRHSFGRHVTMACYERAAPEVARLWQSLGLDPPALCGVYGSLYVDICPPSFQTELLPDGTTSVPLRPEFPARRGEVEPPWLGALPDRPTVYATLGTAFNDPEDFRLILGALAEIDCNVVATIGNDNDPAALEPIPANARVERYASQALVIRHADAVVSHGGSGSMLASFAAGLPTVVLPRAADQFENAGRCVELGAGVALLPAQLTAGAVRDAVDVVLAEPAYRTAARRLADEIAAMPPARDVARQLADGAAATSDQSPAAAAGRGV